MVTIKHEFLEQDNEYSCHMIYDIKSADGVATFSSCGYGKTEKEAFENMRKFLIDICAELNENANAIKEVDESELKASLYAHNIEYVVETSEEVKE